MTDINSIEDEDVLYKMLNGIEDFDERKKIRARIRDLREAKAAAIAQQKQTREESQEDALQVRQRRADEAKQRKLKQYDEDAKKGKKDIGIVEQSIRERLADADAEKTRKLENLSEMGKAMTQVYHAGSEILMKAENDKDKRIKELNEEGVLRCTKTEKNRDGGITTTSTTVSTQKIKDGTTTVTKQTKEVSQNSGLGGTASCLSKASADDVAKNLAGRLKNHSSSTSGYITVTTEEWNSTDGVMKRTEGSQILGNNKAKSGPRGARAAFQQMDKETAPTGGEKPKIFGAGSGPGIGRTGGRVAVQRSPSAIKQMLLDWCKAMTKEYEPKVCITNFSSSWNNGLAFCALIHHFYPSAFSFDELDPKNRRFNFTLAFETAEKEADIAPLLDVDDMVRMKTPDWKCVFCYVQSFYRRFRADSTTSSQNKK